MLDGGRGFNYMSGGAGRDLFVIDPNWPPHAPSPNLPNDYNVILDFETRGPGGDNLLGDLIDLRVLMDQRTTFTGTTADQAAAQGYLYFVQVYGSTRVMIDPNRRAPDVGSSHDFQAVDLSGVAVDQLGAIGQEFFGYSNHILV